MISLILPPKDQVSRVQKMLTIEYGTASNIKSRVNRLSVLGAITSVQQRLKLYSVVPDNGLVLYCGTVLTAENKEKKVSIDFEPFKPINTSLYLCDNKFHTEALHELLESDDKFGFIVMDGNGSLFGTLAGNHRTILHKVSVDLPKKHGRGGQSALRFARLRLEKRHNYVRKVNHSFSRCTPAPSLPCTHKSLPPSYTHNRQVAELATQMFIQDDKPTVRGLVLAGSAEFKQKLHGSDLFDPRLLNIVTKVVDVSYGGENGFNQAIELSADALSNVKFIQEKKLLTAYFSEISRDTGKFCFGVEDTLKALDMGAVDTIVVWEQLEVNRYKLRNTVTGEESFKMLSVQQEQRNDNFVSKEGEELEIIEQTPLLEWLAQCFKDFGAKLEFITDRSQEGSQFCKGFGGIGGILRYQIDFASLDEDNYNLDDDVEDDTGAADYFDDEEYEDFI